jgi:choline kinase
MEGRLGQGATVTAVVLAAGTGSRLGGSAGGSVGDSGSSIPKALLSVGGLTLLDRLAWQCAAARIHELVIVTGHASESLEAWVADSDVPLPMRTVHNPRYASTSNAESLRLALASISGGRVVKFDGDVLIHSGILDRLLAAHGRTTLLFDAARSLSPEDMKIRHVEGRLVELGKDLAVPGASGVSLGIESIDPGDVESLQHRLATACEGRPYDACWYEDAYRLMIDSGHSFACLDVAGLPWTEIDTPADLEAARELVARLDPVVR